jgi:hypothetical protein
MYDKLKGHLGHKVVVAWYGEKADPDNIAIECETCHEILADWDKPKARAPKIKASDNDQWAYWHSGAPMGNLSGRDG